MLCVLPACGRSRGSILALAAYAGAPARLSAFRRLDCCPSAWPPAPRFGDGVIDGFNLPAQNRRELLQETNAAMGRIVKP